MRIAHGLCLAMVCGLLAASCRSPTPSSEASPNTQSTANAQQGATDTPGTAQGGDAPSRLDEAALKRAKAHTEAAFAAIAANDCTALTPLLAGVHDEAACTHFLGEAQSHGLSLVSVDSATVDGRAPQVAIISISVSERGTQKPMLVRARRVALDGAERKESWELTIE